MSERGGQASVRSDTRNNWMLVNKSLYLCFLREERTIMEEEEEEDWRKKKRRKLRGGRSRSWKKKRPRN